MNLSDLTPESLADLDDREFRDVVAADLRRDASNPRIRVDVPRWITVELRGPMAERRLTALRQMVAVTDGQLEHAADAGARGRMLRFRSAVAEAIPEAERLAAGEVTRLRSAIQMHRRLTLADGSIEPSSIDRQLWDTLDS